MTFYKVGGLIMTGYWQQTIEIVQAQARGDKQWVK